MNILEQFGYFSLWDGQLNHKQFALKFSYLTKYLTSYNSIIHILLLHNVRWIFYIILWKDKGVKSLFFFIIIVFQMLRATITAILIITAITFDWVKRYLLEHDTLAIQDKFFFVDYKGQMNVLFCWFCFWFEIKCNFYSWNDVTHEVIIWALTSIFTTVEESACRVVARKKLENVLSIELELVHVLVQFIQSFNQLLDSVCFEPTYTKHWRSFAKNNVPQTITTNTQVFEGRFKEQKKLFKYSPLLYICPYDHWIYSSFICGLLQIRLLCWRKCHAKLVRLVDKKNVIQILMVVHCSCALLIDMNPVNLTVEDFFCVNHSFNMKRCILRIFMIISMALTGLKVSEKLIRLLDHFKY